MSAPSAEPPLQPTISLKRALGLFAVTATGVGLILGAGIYVLVGPAAELAGNAVWASFLLAALVAVLTGLSYAELSSMYPRAGASYEYVRHAFGLRAGFVVGWLVTLSLVVSVAAVALGFAGYFADLFQAPATLVAVGLIAAAGLLAFWGIRESAWLAIALTAIEVTGLLVVVAVGLPRLGDVDLLESATGLSGVLQATAFVFFAYVGFENVANLAEEAHQPERNIPRAIVLAVAITSVVYVLVALAAVSLVGWRALGSSDAPLAAAVQVALGERWADTLSVMALGATANTVLFMLIVASRIIYGMANAGSLPPALSRVHRSRRTPWLAVLAVSVGGAAFALAGDIGAVAQLTNFAIIASFVVVNLALVRLRQSQPQTPRPFKLSLTLRGAPVSALLGAGLCAYLLSTIDLPVALLGLGLAAAGFAADEAHRWWEARRARGAAGPP